MAAWRKLATDYVHRFRELGAAPSFPIQQEGVLYHCPLTLRKRHNLALQSINKRLLHRREVALPHILHVGVTTLCNLRCPGCPTGTKALGRKGEHLDFDLYRRVVDELRSTLMFMLFWDWGEPLMHPRLADMIAHAKQSQIKTVISTSGTIFNSQDHIDRLVAARPDVVIVCIDGATQETYSTYRVGGKLSDAMATLERLADAKQRQQSVYPLIEFRSLATKYTESQMPQLLAMAEDVGADVFSVKTLRPYDYRGRDIDQELAPLSENLARYVYEGDGQRDRANRAPAYGGPLTCGKPLYAPTLNSDGQIAFCSYSKSDAEKFGDVSQRSFRRLWQSPQAAAKRHEFLAKNGADPCRTCYFRTENKPTVIHTVPLRPFPDDLSLLTVRSKPDFLAAVSRQAA
jgi:radical SAM protein with 4Fe4S-binding SPASM domain